MTDMQVKMVKLLYDETEFGMMDCKSALQELAWDMTEAKERLLEAQELRKFASLITVRKKH